MKSIEKSVRVWIDNRFEIGRIGSNLDPSRKSSGKEFILSFQCFVAHPTKERSRTFINVRHHGRMKILRANSDGVIRLDDSCHDFSLAIITFASTCDSFFGARFPEDTSIEDRHRSSFRFVSFRCRPLRNSPAIGRLFVNNLHVDPSFFFLFLDPFRNDTRFS